jgi:alpha-D-ribose 1-methylphosphonate 5-triphosphate synthase subunit PhnH
MDTALEGGFTHPVMHAQSSFRAIMDALANPGSIQPLTQPATVLATLGPDLASVLLTLADADTTIWLGETLRSAEISTFVGFHTGAPLTRDPQKSQFAFASTAAELPPLNQFSLGTQEYPDRSTTIVLAVSSLTGGADLTIRGPGIKDHAHIAPVGLPGDFVAQWFVNRAEFPRGVDLLLVADGGVMGLPRSTRISEGH